MSFGGVFTAEVKSAEVMCDTRRRSRDDGSAMVGVTSVLLLAVATSCNVVDAASSPGVCPSSCRCTAGSAVVVSCSGVSAAVADRAARAPSRSQPPVVAPGRRLRRQPEAGGARRPCQLPGRDAGRQRGAAPPVARQPQRQLQPPHQSAARSRLPLHHSTQLHRLLRSV